MEIGNPIKIITVKPLHEPVPQWNPERPVSVPQEEPVLIPAFVEPEKVEP